MLANGGWLADVWFLYFDFEGRHRLMLVLACGAFAVDARHPIFLEGFAGLRLVGCRIFGGESSLWGAGLHGGQPGPGTVVQK